MLPFERHLNAQMQRFNKLHRKDKVIAKKLPKNLVIRKILRTFANVKYEVSEVIIVRDKMDCRD